MTPKPPSSSEKSSLSPRSRPNLETFLKDSNESDLWAFDDINPAEKNLISPTPRSSPAEIPARRKAREQHQPESDAPPSETTLGSLGSIQVNVSNKGLRPKPQVTTDPRITTSGDVFDDLDHWDETESVAPIPEIQPEVASVPSVAEKTVVEAAAAPENTPSAAVEEVAEVADGFDEFSPVVPENATPVSLVPHLRLSVVERIGLWSLLGMLLVGGGVLYVATIQRLPTETVRVKVGDFPVKGRHLTVLSADTFWRAPIMEGKNVETFRRGTQLLPVVKLAASDGPAAVRLFFRNEDGLVMGDAVTRTIQPGEPVEIAATAGFDDVGMHAAYRIGQSKPWTIEVFEAASATSENEDFKKLFEINISTDRR